MKKVVDVDLAIATWALSPAAPGGQSKAEIEALIKAKLDEGWDLPEGNVMMVKSNFGERGELTHVVNQFIFVKYWDDAVEVKSKK